MRTFVSKMLTNSGPGCLEAQLNWRVSLDILWCVCFMDSQSVSVVLRQTCNTDQKVISNLLKLNVAQLEMMLQISLGRVGLWKDHLLFLNVTHWLEGGGRLLVISWWKVCRCLGRCVSPINLPSSHQPLQSLSGGSNLKLSLINKWRCRRQDEWRYRWSPYH